MSAPATETDLDEDVRKNEGVVPSSPSPPRSPSPQAERPKDLPIPSTPDPFSPHSTPSPLPQERRHLVEVLRDHGGSGRSGELLKQAVAEALSGLGVQVEFVRSKGKARKSPRGRDRHHSGSGQNKEGLKRMADVILSSGTELRVPFLIKETCEFIRKDMTAQGIFRISGAAQRASGIMQRFCNLEMEDFFVQCDTVHDVATVLKQYLREMEVPLIPHNLQKPFIQSLQLSEPAKTSAVLLCICLLPPENVESLSFLLQFLSEVAECSSENLMTFENLAIIFGLNLMPLPPLDPRNKVKDQKMDRLILDQHNQVVEILLKNACSVGQVTEDVQRRLDTLISLRSSEDELESEGVGRRKKRRSGSLNRMLGFLKKVTGKSGLETPATPLCSTPGDFSYSQTPVIKGSMSITDSKRKKRFIFEKKTSSKISTPLPLIDSSISPAYCLDPSPMRGECKETPGSATGKGFKSLMTPGLLRKRDKNAGTNKEKEEKFLFSAPSKPSKPRLRFGRSQKNPTSSKKDGGAYLGTPDADVILSVPVRNLNKSPVKAKKNSPPSSSSLRPAGGSQSRIPRPGLDKPAVPPKNFPSGTKLRNNSSKTSLMSKEGEYVTISAAAGMLDPDPKNEAFLASSNSISLLTATNTTGGTLDIDVSKDGSATDYELTPTDPEASSLHLTPLIREIEALTKKTEYDDEMLRSAMKGVGCGGTLPERVELDTTPLTADQVEQKFIRALKETKVIQIQSDKKGGTGAIPPRMSCSRNTSMSPSQRRIVQKAVNRRRQSHEPNRVTPTVTPQPRSRSLRSPRPSEKANDKDQAGALKRSPNRCTLKRGRPNSTRVGLSRPTTPRPTSASTSTGKEEGEEAGTLGTQTASTSGTPPPRPPKKEVSDDVETPIRRMSSVQELLQKLDPNRAKLKEKKEGILKTVKATPTPKHPQTIILSPPPALPPKTPSTSTNVAFSLPPRSVENDKEDGWVSGTKFRFERLRDLERSCDRESIHYLKTLRAGKVPATVEYFNKIVDCQKKSPTATSGKSLIPRYTGLPCQEKGSGEAFAKEKTPGLILTPQSSTPSRIARRMSTADLDAQRKEELLEKIKREVGVKRSNTTAGRTTTPTGMMTRSRVRPCTLALSLVPEDEVANTKSPVPVSRKNSARHRGQDDGKSPSSTKPVSRSSSLRKQRRHEENVESIEKALENLLTLKEFGSRKIATSPLKSSNIANTNPPSITKGTPNSPPMRSVTLSRTASEAGTRATFATCDKTPKIRKALTTRAYDMKVTDTPTPRVKRTPSTANNKRIPVETVSQKQTNCPSTTPRRRVPRMGHGGPQNQNQGLGLSQSNITPLAKLRTPLRVKPNAPQ